LFLAQGRLGKLRRVGKEGGGEGEGTPMTLIRSPKSPEEGNHFVIGGLLFLVINYIWTFTNRASSKLARDPVTFEEAKVVRKVP
jgi:hypothetical protein